MEYITINKSWLPEDITFKFHQLIQRSPFIINHSMKTPSAAMTKSGNRPWPLQIGHHIGNCLSHRVQSATGSFVGLWLNYVPYIIVKWVEVQRAGWLKLWWLVTRDIPLQPFWCYLALRVGAESCWKMYGQSAETQLIHSFTTSWSTSRYS